MVHHLLMLEYVTQRAPEFDIIHYHIEYAHFPLARRQRAPHVTTLHGRLDISERQPFYREFRDAPLISISDSQRKPLPHNNWVATVYHGLPTDLYTFHEKPLQYLAFLGRVSPEKGVDRAIEIARRAGMEIQISAKVDAADKDYYESVVEPLFNDPLARYVGEVGEKEKNELLGNAYALLFPIDWPEPFGMVMIEAMACGTPVIACRNGSVPEVIEDGVTGLIVDDLDAAVKAVERIPSISRRRCREVFEQRFSASRMARDYMAAYERLLQRLPVALSA